MAVLAERLIGSRARGDADEHSDWDVLVITDRRLTPRDREYLEREYTDRLGHEVELSAYGADFFRGMVRDGHLFAWHVWQDSQRIGSSRDVVDDFGEPAPCPNAYTEASDLADDLTATIQRLADGTPNLVFDAGIAYICVRNIAIHMSWFQDGALTFSRNAPLVVQWDIPFPLDETTYTSLYSARTARKRPARAPAFRRDDLLGSLGAAESWARELLSHPRRPRDAPSGRRLRFRERVAFESAVLGAVNGFFPGLFGLSHPAVKHWESRHSERGVANAVRILHEAADSANALADRSSDAYKDAEDIAAASASVFVARIGRALVEPT